MLSDSQLGNVECPICQSDLSSLRSSYQRQQHVERCLTAGDQPTQQDDNEFDYCIFCGKCITHLVRKDVHFSKCLDELALEERAQQDASFAGQPMPFLNDLDICPCCHEFSPMQSRPIRQKVIHIKQCIKRRGMTIQQLLQKMQWIQWDYTPERRPAKPPSPRPIQQRKIPQMIVQATVAANDDDDDFSSTVIVHKRAMPTLSKRQRQEQDKMDDELQLALALSRSESNSKRVKVDANATNIVPIEDSRKFAYQALKQLLSRQDSDGCCSETEALPPSRIGRRYSWSLWELASLSTSPENQAFVSSFVLELKSSSRPT